MPDKPIELSIEVPAETRREIERAAAERGMTVPEFLEEALRKYLVIPATSTKRLPPISNRGWARQFEEPIGLPDGRKLGRVLINPAQCASLRKRLNCCAAARRRDGPRSDKASLASLQTTQMFSIAVLTYWDRVLVSFVPQ